jgi:ubiquinone/menaquinone biosynthesis C-methylase UbiE
VDLSQEKIAAAHRLFPEVPACRADAGSLPFPDRNFDVVLFRHLVELLPVGLIESALAEGARVARKALVLDFCGPTRAGANRIEALLVNAGWRLRERFAIAAAREKDELWVFVPGSEQ